MDFVLFHDDLFRDAFNDTPLLVGFILRPMPMQICGFLHDLGSRDLLSFQCIKLAL
jgi:hypothetical protein